MKKVILINPKDIPQVSVSYGDSKFMLGTAFEGTDFFKELVDMRWSPYYSPSGRFAGERIVVHIDKWFVEGKFRQQLGDRVIGQHLWRDGDTIPSDAADDYIAECNVRLAVMNHFGFDIQYNDQYIKWFGDHICDIIMHAYRGDPENTLSDRHFHGRRYSRKEWVVLVESFMTNNGI